MCNNNSNTIKLKIINVFLVRSSQDASNVTSTFGI